MRRTWTKAALLEKLEWLSDRCGALEKEAAAWRSLLRALPELPVLVWTTDSQLRITSLAGDEGMVPESYEMGRELREVFGAQIAGLHPTVDDSKVYGACRWNGADFRVVVVPIQNERGEFEGSLGAAVGIEDPHEADRAAIASHAGGRSMSEAAREASELLTEIFVNANLLASEVNLTGTHREALQSILSSAEQTAELTARLFQYLEGEPAPPSSSIIADSVRRSDPPSNVRGSLALSCEDAGFAVMLTRLLSGLGYAVEPIEALPRVVLVDMSNIRALRRKVTALLGQDAQLRIIVLGGVQRDWVDFENVECLEKPFHLGDLSAAVGRATSRGSAQNA